MTPEPPIPDETLAELKGVTSPFTAYADPAACTRLRLFEEPVEVWTRWSIDGADDGGRYTEACWSFDTEAEARAAIPEFCEAYGIPADLPVTRSGL